MIMISKKILYKDWIYTWLQEKKDYIKESTYGTYSNNVFNYIIPTLGDYPLKKLNHKLLQDFILELSKRGKNNKTEGLSDKTIKDIMIIIKASIRKGINENKIKYFDLSFNYPKPSKFKNIYVLTKQEQNKLTNFVLNNLTAKNIGILIALYSGLRIGELCALKWNDIDFKHNSLTISKTIQRIYIKDKYNTVSKVIITTPKTRNANRVIPISNELIEILRKLKANDNYYVLSNNEKFIEPRTYRKYFNQVLIKNKIRHFNFHSLRHTFATNCITLGADYKTVSELLGHSNINITLNIYVHPKYSEKKKCINLISKVLKDK